MSGGDRQGLPIRRHSFRAADFAAYLAASGAEIGTPTNVYEVIRYKAFWQGGKKAITHIVYAKENGLLTYTGGSADHYRAFQSAGSIEVDESRVRRKALGHLRPKLVARDGDECWYCAGGLDAEPSNVEHLINVSDGGTNALANLVMAHVGCNTKAGNMPLARKLELRAELRARANFPAASQPVPQADGTHNAGIEAAGGKGSL